MNIIDETNQSIAITERGNCCGEKRRIERDNAIVDISEQLNNLRYSFGVAYFQKTL